MDKDDNWFEIGKEILLAGHGEETLEMKDKAQTECCDRQKAPRFAPNSCFSCGRPVLEGYSLEYCSKHVISGCPFCHYSFVN